MQEVFSWMPLVGNALTGLITGLSTLGGIIITQSMNNKSRKAQETQEKWKANRELYLNKAEEVLIYIDNWHENIHQIMLVQIDRVSGVLANGDDLKNLADIVDKTLVPKVRMNLALYFDELNDLFEETAKCEGNMFLEYGLFIAGTKKDVEDIIFNINSNRVRLSTNITIIKDRIIKQTREKIQ